MKSKTIYNFLILVIPFIPRHVLAKEESSILNNMVSLNNILEPNTLKYLILILIIVILIITSSILFSNDK